MYHKKRVKIVSFYYVDDLEASSRITEMINWGWVIVAAGGYGEDRGFIVLQREFSDEEIKEEIEYDREQEQYDGPDTTDEALGIR
jgi:hypothetical protein